LPGKTKISHTGQAAQDRPSQ